MDLVTAVGSNMWLEVEGEEGKEAFKIKMQTGERGRGGKGHKKDGQKAQKIKMRSKGGRRGSGRPPDKGLLRCQQ